MAYYKKQIHLIKGNLQIFTIEGSKKQTWYCIIKIGNHTRIRKSTKQTLRREAERFAYNEYNKYRALAEGGLPLLETSWKEMVTLYNDAKGFGKTTKHRLGMLEIYFGKVTNIKDINQTMITGWEKWRKAFWTSKQGRKYIKDHNIIGGRHINKDFQLSNTTLYMEAVVLRSVLKYAKERGIIAFIPAIKTLNKHRTFKADGTHRRAAFTNSQHASILRYLNHEYSVLCKKSQQKTTGYYHAKAKGVEYMLFPKQRNRRMHFWCLFLASSGVRPQTARLLRFKDIKAYDDHVNNAVLAEVTISAKISKTNEPRTIYIIDSGATNSGSSLVLEHLKKWQAMARFNEPDDLIFSNTNEMGERSKPAQMTLYFSRMIKTFGKAGSKAENYAEFKAEDGKEYTSYSYRHRFITNAIKKGVTPYFISVYCGTGIQNLKRHYAHIIGADLRDHMFEKSIEAQERREALMNRSVVELSKVV